MPSHNRPRELPPLGTRISIEVRGRAGERLLVEGRLAGTPEGYGSVVTKLVVDDAVAEPIT